MDWKVDWATETASKLMHGVAKLGDKSVGGIFEVSEIATALREAKAEDYAAFKAIYSRKSDGKWRECNNCNSFSVCKDSGCRRASEIENGNS